MKILTATEAKEKSNANYKLQYKKLVNKEREIIEESINKAVSNGGQYVRIATSSLYEENALELVNLGYKIKSGEVAKIGYVMIYW